MTILKVMNDDDPEERVQSMKSLLKLIYEEREKDTISQQKFNLVLIQNSDVRSNTAQETVKQSLMAPPKNSQLI